MDSLQARGMVTTAAVLLTLNLALAGCGGSGGESAASGGQPPANSPQAVQGVATPSSVSVVTAKNAN